MSLGTLEKVSVYGGDLENLSKDEIIERIRDPKFFCESLLKIRNKNGEIVPMKLKQAQLKLFNTLAIHDLIMVLKARQMGMCLDGDTEILMADGTFMRIEHIAAGDEVIAADGKPAKVTKTWCRKSNERMQMILVEGCDKPIKATENHLILVTQKGAESEDWVPMKNVEIGDEISFPGDVRKRITRKFEVATPECVYDITIEEGHGAAFTTAAGIVHNSSASVAWLFHRAITVPGTTCLIIGYSAALATELLDKIRTFIELMPAELRPTIKYFSRNEITFPNLKSKVQVIASDRAGRGYAYSHSLFTELPFVDRAEEKLTALLGGLPNGGKLILESSPGMTGDLFHSLWTDETNAYKKLEFGPWWEYSEEDLEQKREAMKNIEGTDEKFRQEFMLEFGVVGRRVFDKDVVRKMRKNILKVGDKVKIKDEEGKDKEWEVCEMLDGLRVYKPPEPDGQYALGADVGEGTSKSNYSVATIFNKRTGEEVAFFRGHVPPGRFGALLAQWGRYYNNALLAPEANNQGILTVQVVRDLVYPNLYYRPAKFDALDVSLSDRIGWKTTVLTRPHIYQDLSAACTDGSIVLHSRETLNEMDTFVFDDLFRAIPMPGYNDDTIFATGIALQALKIMYVGDLKQIDIRRMYFG